MSSNKPTISIKGRRGTRLALSWRAAAGDPSLPRLPASAPGMLGRPAARGKHDGCYRLLEIAGIPVRFHRSTLALFAALTTASFWIGSGLAWFAFAIFTVMLVHELGHAAFARRLGYQVSEIRLFPFFGQCRYARPYSAFEDAVIAWGGIAAQLLLLVPALATLTLFGNTRYGSLNVFLVVFSYFNAVTMLLNLVPARRMDGAKAWRLPLMILRAKWTMRSLRRSKLLR